MSFINIILFSLLFLQSISQEEEGLVQEDYGKCMKANFMGGVTTEDCTDVTSTLESTGDYEGQCCLLSFKTDPLAGIKRMFGEDWKAKIMEQYELDEDLTDEEIIEKIGLKGEQSMCSLLTKVGKNVGLYSMALNSLDGEVTYDCGDGKETFNSKDFIPKTDYEKKNKDMADCGTATDEKTCNKKSSKLITNEAQCCWCEASSIGGMDFGFQNCIGYPTGDLEEYLKNTAKTYNTGEGMGMKMKMTCSCLDKNGKSTSILTNSVTGEIIIE